MKSLPSSQIKKRLRGLAALILLSLISTIISYPEQAAAQCSSPAGVAGQIIFGEDENVPAYCDGTDWIGMAGGNPITGGGDYVPNAVFFDGSSDELRIETQLTGITDGTTLTGSFWYNETTISAQQELYSSNADFVSLRFQDYGSGPKATFGARRTDGTLILQAEVDLPTDGEWHHILFSFDTANSANNRIYIDDVNQSISYFSGTPLPGTIDFTRPGHYFSSNSALYDGGLAEFWWQPNLFLDLDVEANRRKFITANGNPVFLGSDGSLPTGTSPMIFLSGDTASWHTNKGTGGGFTESGALTDFATSPYTQRTKIVPTGLLGHWRLDETTGSIAYDSSGNNRHGTEASGMNISSNTSVGVINNSINFGGGGERIDIPDDPEWTLSSGKEMTIAGWVNFSTIPQSPTDWDAMISADAADLWGFEFNGVSGSSIRLNWWDDTTDYISPAQNILPNTWYHVAITIELGGSDTSNWWFNGEDIGSFSPANVSIDPASISIGGVGGSTAFTGLLDDVRIYNRRLSAEEMSLLASAKDGIRYNESHRSLEFFDGNQFVSMTPQWPEPAVTKTIFNCTNPGDVCADGTVFAGYSTDGNVPMFTTRCNQGQSWNGSACTGTAANLTFTDGGSNYLQTTAISDDDGDGNTAILLVEDSNSGVAGIQPHDAAVSCDSLADSGHSDWYLPAENELDVLFTNRNAIGNFESDQYWSSSDSSGTPHAAYRVTFPSGTSGVATKNGNFTVRCVRQGSFTTSGVGSLVGHWKLDETKGSTAVDSSGNGNNGSMNSNLVSEEDSIQGAVGTALHFKNKNPTVSNSGANAIINVPDLLSDTDDATLSAWVYPVRTANTAYMRLFGGVDWIAVINSNGTLSYTLSGGSALVSSAAFSTDRVWTHLALTYDASTKEQKIFINGTEDASQIDSSISFATFLTGISHTFNGYEGGLDDVRLYSRALTETEISQLYQLGAPVGNSTALPQGCPNIGDVCDDGTFYAGLSPDGNVAMFTTTESAGVMPWNNGNSTGKVSTGVGGSGATGEANTISIASSDADSGTAGFQPNQAAQYCFDLVSNGSDDWYLPATDEADILVNNYDVLNYPTSGGAEIELHWESNEAGANDGFDSGFFAGSILLNGSDVKEADRNVRCVRKGPAPRCANPYGLEGQVIYNSCYSVVQYCDGARWIMIGKSEAVNDCL